MLFTFFLSLLALTSINVSANPLDARSIAAHSTAPVKAAWYAGWHATDGFPLSSVSWDKYNTLYYSFA